MAEMKEGKRSRQMAGGPASTPTFADAIAAQERAIRLAFGSANTSTTNTRPAGPPPPARIRPGQPSQLDQEQARIPADHIGPVYNGWANPNYREPGRRSRQMMGAEQLYNTDRPAPFQQQYPDPGPQGSYFQRLEVPQALRQPAPQPQWQYQGQLQAQPQQPQPQQQGDPVGGLINLLSRLWPGG